MVVLDLMTKRQQKQFIIDEVKKSKDFYYSDMEQLRKKIQRLEEEIKILSHTIERRLKKDEKDF